MTNHTPLLHDKLAWDGKTLVVTGDGLVENKLRRAALSPSTSKSMQSCAARWVGERLLRSEEEDPFAPAPLGTSGHAVLEDLFDVREYAVEMRTMRTAAAIVEQHADKLWADDPEADDAVRAAVRINRYRWIADVRTSYEGLWTIEDPKSINVWGRETQIDGLFLNGVPINGFIDRIQEGVGAITGNYGLTAEDYKGLAVDTPIPTPTGWTTMGALSKGDIVLGSDGKPTSVIAKSGTHHRKCYEVIFSDGTKIVCDNVHLWQIVDTYRGKAKGSETVDADDLYRRVSARGAGSISIHIPNTAPLELPAAELPINPWVLGAWLGDGKGATGELSVGDQDLDEMSGLVAANWGVSRTRLERTSHQITLAGDRKEGSLLTEWKETGDTVFHKAPLRRFLSEAGLLNNKHIPAAYLRGSYEQRLELLQGLMDTDGHFHKGRGRGVFVTTNPELAAGVRELISSLGVTVQWFQKDYTNAVRPDATVFQLEFRPLDFVPFQLERKAGPVREMQAAYTRFPRGTERSLRRDIVGMTVVESVPTECIAVDAADQLYLCGTTMIPTHNTGKVPSKYSLRYGDDHGDQLRIYAAALEAKTGEKAVGATVLYTKFGEKRDVDLSESAMAKTLKTFELSWTRHNRYMKNAEFPTKVSALCGWCPLVNSCPVAKAEGKEGKIDGLLSATDLGIPSLRPGAAAAPEPEQDDSVDHEGNLVLFAPDLSEISASDLALVERAGEVAAHMKVSGENPKNDSDEEDMPKITEDKVWIETVSGELNPNSFASIAAMGTASLAVDVLSKAGIELKGSTVKALNFTFLSIVSDAQFNWTGSRSLMDGANTRMRGALRSVIDSMPLPFGQDEAAWDAWVDAALRRCKAITSVGLAGYHEEAPERPWATLAGLAPADTAEPVKAAPKARAKAPAKVAPVAAEAPVEAPVAEAPAVEAVVEAPAVEATVTPIKAAPKSAGFSSHDFPDEDEDAA